MSKPKAIIINIPKPCQEDWNEMQANGDGKYCKHCSKTVIDFTNWNDTDLYHYLNNHKNERICGHVSSTQINRAISLPQQPSTKLYRIAIALGFTVLMINTPQSNVFAKAPFAVENNITNIGQEDKNETGDSIVIRGKVLDEKGEPMISAIVMVMNDSSIIGGEATDYDGKFEIVLKEIPAKKNLFLRTRYTSYIDDSTKINTEKLESFYTIKMELRTFSGLIENVIYKYSPSNSVEGNPGGSQKFNSEQLKNMEH